MTAFVSVLVTCYDEDDGHFVGAKRAVAVRVVFGEIYIFVGSGDGTLNIFCQAACKFRTVNSGIEMVFVQFDFDDTVVVRSAGFFDWSEAELSITDSLVIMVELPFFVSEDFFRPNAIGRLDFLVVIFKKNDKQRKSSW